MAITRCLANTAAVKTRTETYEGREHIVVPVVALVEGVVQAMNATAPEFVSAEEATKFPTGWNGRPVYVDHPMEEGEPVSGNSPELLESQRIGVVFNATSSKGRLLMEAWIDVERAKEIAPELLERIEAGDPIEISVGAFTETDDSEGVYEGKKYRGAWKNIVPDHLALLSKGHKGACSREMGCGVRAAKGAVVPDEKNQVTAKNASMFSRALRAALEMFRGSQSASDMSDNDVRRKLGDAIRAIVPNVSYVEAVYDDKFVYCIYNYALANGITEYYERTFTLATNGEITIGAEAIAVEPVLYYEPVKAEPTVAGVKETPAPTAEVTAATGAPCGCKNNAAPTTMSEVEMNKEQITKFLETATEDQIKSLSAVAEGKPAVVAAAPVVAEAPKPVTFDQILATASPEQRDAINEGLRAGQARKATTIKSLKDTTRCPYSDEELGKMTQADLDRLVTLAGSTVAAVDHSITAPRAAETQEEVPAAPDMTERIKAAQAKK